MIYETTYIKSIKECEVLIDKAHALKNDLDTAVNAIKYKMETEFQEPPELESKLMLVREQIQQLQSYLPNLPQGDMKRIKEMELLNLKMQLRNLEKIQKEGSIVFYLELQFEIARLNAQLSCVDAFILSLARKKAELRKFSDQAA